MPYIENRVVHDADAHTMELPNWFDEFGTKQVQEAFRKRFKGQKGLAHTFFEDIEETQLQEFIGPINEDCLAEGLVVGKVVVAKMPTCSSLNRIDVSSEYDCGVCAEGYVEDTDENSETYGQCIEEVDNTLLYAGVGGVALLLLIVALK